MGKSVGHPTGGKGSSQVLLFGRRVGRSDHPVPLGSSAFLGARAVAAASLNQGCGDKQRRQLSTKVSMDPSRHTATCLAMARNNSSDTKAGFRRPSLPSL